MLVKENMTMSKQPEDDDYLSSMPARSVRFESGPFVMDVDPVMTLDKHGNPVVLTRRPGQFSHRVRPRVLVMLLTENSIPTPTFLEPYSAEESIGGTLYEGENVTIRIADEVLETAPVQYIVQVNNEKSRSMFSESVFKLFKEHNMPAPRLMYNSDDEIDIADAFACQDY